MDDIEGSVVVITGAGRGLGRAYARLYAEHGAHVVVNDRDEEPLDQVVEEIRSAGGDAVGHCDAVGSPEVSDRLVGAALDAFGRLDVMITNAGADRRGPVLDLEPSDWQFTLETHLLGSIYDSVAAARQMRDQGDGGTIVNVVATTFYVPRPAISPYGVAKGGIYALTGQLALELAPFGITVNAISPTLTATGPALAFVESKDTPREMAQEMLALLHQPEEEAPLAVFLATEAGHRFTGQTLTLTREVLTALRPPEDVELARTDAGAWTVDDLVQTLG